MSLISATNAKTYTDHLAAAWIRVKDILGRQSAGPVSGNVQQDYKNLQDLIAVTLDDYEQQLDLGQATADALLAASVDDYFAGTLSKPLNAINNHCSQRGSSVDSTINSLATFLKYYNGGSGGALFANMVVPEFNDLWQAVKGTSSTTGYLPSSNVGAAVATAYSGVMSPAIRPANGQANGMGVVNQANTYTAGAAVTRSATEGQKSYAEVKLIAVVTVNFADGTAAPAVTVTGVDHLGNSGQTWTGTWTGNNPVAALAGRTITPSITANARATVAMSSAAGVVPGSWLTINSGLVDEELILVEAVSSNDITAVFRKAHGAGATVTGSTTLTLTNASSRRCRSVTNVQQTLTDHTAGTIRIEGVQDRAAI